MEVERSFMEMIPPNIVHTSLQIMRFAPSYHVTQTALWGGASGSPHEGCGV